MTFGKVRFSHLAEISGIPSNSNGGTGQRTTFGNNLEVGELHLQFTHDGDVR